LLSDNLKTIGKEAGNMPTAPAPDAKEPRPADMTDAVESVRYLRREWGLTEADLADGTGASQRTVRRWAQDRTQPQARYQRQIDDLRSIVQVLQDSLTAKGMRQWLRSRNRYLEEQRPIDLLREGKFERVHEAAQAFQEGYYL
jgi:DNA-binding transcriptional regulator YiaG